MRLRERLDALRLRVEQEAEPTRTTLLSVCLLLDGVISELESQVGTAICGTCRGKMKLRAAAGQVILMCERCDA